MAQDNLATIQAALKAVGDTSDDSGLEPLQTDKVIRDALEAASKPVKVIKPPDKTADDFLSGGYPSVREGAARGAGTAAGELGLLGQGLMFLPSGLAYLAGLPFGTDKAAAAQRATVNLLNPTTDWSGKPLGSTTPFGEAAQRPSDWLSRAIEGTAEGGGDILSRATDPNAPVENANFQSRFGISIPQGKPLTTAQEAKREAPIRSASEAATNALMALAGLKGGGEAVTEQAGRVPFVRERPTPAVQPAEVPRETPMAPPPANDFQARMQEAAPKPPTPEAPAPAKVQSDMAALEAPYRYRPEKDAATVLPKLPKYLSGAKPKMGEQKLEFASDLDRAAYIVANPRTRSGSHADYLDWLAKALGTDENTALLLAKRSKEATVASVKAGQPKIQPYLHPKRGESPVALPEEPRQAPETQARTTDEPLVALDKALQGTSLTRTPVPEGMRDSFAQENHLRMGQGQGEPLPYVQLVRDVFPSAADEVINAIGEKVFQQGKGDPTRVHLPPDDLKALDQALSQRGWPVHRRDLLEKLSAALTYALDNRQARNEGYAPMRAAIQDHNLMGDVLRNPENYAVTAKLREFKPPRDFEKVCV